MKDKSKRKALFPDALPIASASQANPFATPRKSKHKSYISRRDPSPDPFPLIHAPKTPSSHKPASKLPTIVGSPSNEDSYPALKDTAITRARKRLRGEPVSPSPVKEKRARVFSRTSSFARQSTLGLHSDDSGEQDAARTIEEPPPAEEAFFNSPVKRPRDGKQFRSLFEEAPVTQQDLPMHPPRQPLSRTKTTAGAVGPFGGEPKRKARMRAFSPELDDEHDHDEPRSGEKIKALDLSLTGRPGKRKPLKHGFPQAVLPGRDDLWDITPSANGAQAGPSKQGIAIAKKRPLSESNMDVDEEPKHEPEQSKPQLLPPSPPPQGAKSSSRYGGKGKGLPAASRKKAKLREGSTSGDEDEDSLEDDVQIKELSWSWNAHAAHTTEGSIPIDSAVDADLDPEFDPTVYRPAPVAALEPVASDGFEVDLPEDMKRLLALSPHHTQKDTLEEARIARELLYGRREAHYVPKRGGEIWDVGEIDEEVGEENLKKTLSDEDEWEGEPVPWEVGEL